MAHVDRRDFMRQTVGGAAMAVPLAAATGAATESDKAFPDKLGEEERSVATLDLTEVPNFCGHEHWGSIDAIGMTQEGFRADTEAGATPARRAGVWDLVLDPYLKGMLSDSEATPDAMAKEAGAADFQAWWANTPDQALRALRPHLERQQFTGTFQCTRRGIQFLHGVDLATLETEAWVQADHAVSARYANLFGWYRAVMTKAHFTELIRPVHPEFYFRRESGATAEAEKAFTRTVLRIDPLLGLWPAVCPRREALAGRVGVEPRDPASWRAFLARLFDMAAEGGAVGIKQLQAYMRSLDFRPRTDADVDWSGALEGDRVAVFQDWVVHECCKQAHERGWPHQVHVGTHNLVHSSPLPLEGLAYRYPAMKVVMLHCWPFLEETAYMAKCVPNVYLDTCWEPVLNPVFLRQALGRWLNYVPMHKIMCAHDSTSVEMAAGSALFTREILAEALAAQGSALRLDGSRLTGAATDLLHDNAVRVYGMGTEVGAL